MEFVLFFGAMFLFLLFIFAREAYSDRKNRKQFIESLYRDYGVVPDKEYSPERYERIAGYYQKHRTEDMLDDITWNDLNMDDVFKRMNYTFSASGEEYLYYTLRNIGKTQAELDHMEEVICFFREHEDERVKIQHLMHQLGYTGKYSLYDYIDHLDYLGQRSNKKHILCNLLFLPLIALAPFEISVSLLGIAVLLIYNILSYFKVKKEIEPYIISFAYIMRLADICEKIIRVPVQVCAGEWQMLKKSTKALTGMRRGSFWVFSMNQLTSGNPLDMIMDYMKMIFHVDLMQFNKMLSQLRLHLDDVDEMISNVGYLETVIAVGALRNSLESFCVPEFAGEKLAIEEAYHLLIADPVKNSIVTDRGVLLTGSNASGKSTFLKTVALNAIFAQTIHTCMAESYRAPMFQVYSSMALRDSIDSGESYYIVEIKALKRILEAVHKTDRTILCFVDEVLRGTNTVERIAASTQILKSLVGNNILCFAATHDIEMTELLKDCYNNYHFEEEVRDGDIFFNYQLLTGKATTRNAIKLLEIMGYDGAIIEKASRQAEVFVESGVWEPV